MTKPKCPHCNGSGLIKRQSLGAAGVPVWNYVPCRCTAEKKSSKR